MGMDGMGVFWAWSFCPGDPLKKLPPMLWLHAHTIGVTANKYHLQMKWQSGYAYLAAYILLNLKGIFLTLVEMRGFLSH